jgi:hypothetical protein
MNISLQETYENIGFFSPLDFQKLAFQTRIPGKETFVVQDFLNSSRQCWQINSLYDFVVGGSDRYLLSTSNPEATFGLSNGSLEQQPFVLHLPGHIFGDSFCCLSTVNGQRGFLELNLSTLDLVQFWSLVDRPNGISKLLSNRRFISRGRGIGIGCYELDSNRQIWKREYSDFLPPDGTVPFGDLVEIGECLFACFVNLQESKVSLFLIDLGNGATVASWPGIQGSPFRFGDRVGVASRYRIAVFDATSQEMNTINCAPVLEPINAVIHRAMSVFTETHCFFVDGGFEATNRFGAIDLSNGTLAGFWELKVDGDFIQRIEVFQNQLYVQTRNWSLNRYRIEFELFAFKIGYPIFDNT